MSRAFELKPLIANLLHDLRVVRGVAQACRIRLSEVEGIEREFECQMPDAVIAYLASGVSAWHSDSVSIERCRELTLAFREMCAEYGYAFERDDELVDTDAFIIFDDDTSGNHIAFRRGAKRAADSIVVLKHRSREVSDESIGDNISRALESEDTKRTNKQIVIQIDDDIAAAAGTKLTVHHVKFGRGEVLRESDDKLTVRFEGGVEKTLKASFLTFE